MAKHKKGKRGRPPGSKNKTSKKDRKAAKLEKKAKKSAKAEKVEKVEKKKGKKKGDSPFREGTFIWAFWAVISGLYKESDKIEINDLKAKITKFCKLPEVKIKFAPARINVLIYWFGQMGWIKRVAHGVYKRAV